MDYPLSLSLPAPDIGFAVANDEAEHIALSDVGYLPAFPGHEVAAPTAEELTEEVALLSRAELVGLKVDKRWSFKRLTAEVIAAEAVKSATAEVAA
jgi:hypothetical protein